MKKNRTIIIVVFVCLVVFGWYTILNGKVSVVKEQKNLEMQAEEYAKKKLYQKAIISYEDVLTEKDTVKNWKRLIELYRLSYEDGTAEARDYSDVIYRACKAHPEEVPFWEQLLEFQLECDNYRNACTYLKTSIREGITSEKLQKMDLQIRYAFKETYRTYPEIHWGPYGYYSVFDGEKWGNIAPEGNELYACDFEYISPYNVMFDAVFVTEKDARVLDAKGIAQAILPEKISKAKALGSGLIPVYDNETWKYMNLDGKALKGEYEDVSSFQNNYALVKKDGKWNFIDNEGNKVGEGTFDNVKLYGNGDYSNQGIMIAQKGNSYSIYDTAGQPKTEFACKDVDLYMGSYIAFQDKGGKWGFVNTKGEVVIEPAYEGAKSFSNGLAAVCKDGKWGFINEKGILVIEYQFLFADYFTSKGCCFVSTVDGLYFMIELRYE